MEVGAASQASAVSTLIQNKQAPQPYGPGRSRVPKRGLEPRRAFAHYALNVARLPIPPLRQAG